MRIAVDVRSLIEGRHSGVEEYATQIIKGLVKSAPWHEYIFFYNSARFVDMSFLSPMGKVLGFRFPNRLFNLCQYLIGWPKWDRLIERKLGYQPDLFFAPNARLLPVMNKAVVVTAHDLSYELFPEFYSVKHRVWHKLMKPKQLMHGANHVIAVSQATKEDVIRLYGVKREKVSVIYSGVSSNKCLEKNIFLSDSGEARDERVLGLPEKYILYLGTMEPRKNIVSIIEAFTSIAEHITQNLVIAGEVGWLMSGIEKAAGNSSVAERIHRIGFVEERAKESLYRQADLFVYPSFYEGFGFPPLEALLVGTPVITSHNSSLPEVVGDWATMINPYDVSELALVMREMISNPPLVNEQVQRQIRKKFSWDNAARQTLDVFDRVLSGK